MGHSKKYKWRHIVMFEIDKLTQWDPSNALGGTNIAEKTKKFKVLLGLTALLLHENQISSLSLSFLYLNTYVLLKRWLLYVY